VLYTTARGVTDGMTALFVEPNGFVAKPYTIEQLKTAVANLLTQKEANPGGVSSGAPQTVSGMPRTAHKPPKKICAAPSPGSMGLG
jgi:hypothetical protein